MFVFRLDLSGWFLGSTSDIHIHVNFLQINVYSFLKLGHNDLIYWGNGWSNLLPSGSAHLIGGIGSL